jgi:hypothetical protein
MKLIELLARSGYPWKNYRYIKVQQTKDGALIFHHKEHPLEEGEFKLQFFEIADDQPTAIIHRDEYFQYLQEREEQRKLYDEWQKLQESKSLVTDSHKGPVIQQTGISNEEMLELKQLIQAHVDKQLEIIKLNPNDFTVESKFSEAKSAEEALYSFLNKIGK